MAKVKEKAKSGKQKSASIVLAVFFNFFSWIYTYEKDALKFWISFGLTIITFGYFLPISWLWALILAISRKQEDFDSISKTTRKKLAILWSILGFVTFIILALATTLIVLLVQQSNKNAEATRARQAVLQQDPINVNNVYAAINKLRTSNGAPALSNLQNLQTAASQYCSVMVQDGFFAYKNPKTGKDSNSYISDNAGGLYFKHWVSSIATGNSAMTATELMTDVGKAQSTNLYDPSYNSVGWAVCDNPTLKNYYVVGMFAEKADKPAQPVINNYNSYSNPYIPKSTTCTSYYSTLLKQTTTTCY